MRKTIVVFMIFVVSFIIGSFLNKRIITDDILLANVEALANPEISFDFCIVQPDLCIVYDDGFAIRGVLQYSVDV